MPASDGLSEHDPVYRAGHPDQRDPYRLRRLPLSRKDLFGRNIFISLFIFTMFFNGGMIPTYLIIQKLGMLNKIWALVLPSAISTYNMIIMRTFFENTIPNELIEAANFRRL